MRTTVEKTKSGWRADTTIDLSEKQVLKLQTRSNTNGGVATWASVHHVEENGMLAHVLMKDYSAAVRIDITVRCTEKVVRGQHEHVLMHLDAIKQSVKAFYGPQEPSNPTWQSYLTAMQPVAEVA